VPHQLLLADHSVTIQRIIRLTFADEDIDVMTVSDGNLAVATIDGSPPDIVLADIGLPGRNGYDVARHLRDTPRLAHIPVVLLTDVFSQIDEARAKAVGCDRILSKPFDPQVVVSCVRELLARPKKIAVAVPPSFDVAEPTTFDAGSSADIDAYFDRLDLSFAGLPASLPEPAAQLDAPSIEIVEDPEPEFGSPDSVSSGAALSYASERAAFDRPFGTAAPEPSAPESHDGSRAGGSPLSQAVDAAAVPIISDEQVDEIATRVLDRLLARLSVGTVPDIVTAVAQRLVTAEIDRIKSRL
jgi:DNA-binding response OmpR family regulator